MLFEEHQKGNIVCSGFLEPTSKEYDDFTVVQIKNEHLAKQDIKKELVGVNDGTDFHSMMNEPAKFEENNTSINDKSFSLILSLRINDQFSLQNHHRSNSELLLPTDYETSTDNRNRLSDMCMEETLFHEEHERNLLPFINPSNPFLPEISFDKMDYKDQPMNMPTSSLTLSLARKSSNTLYKIPHLSSNDNHSIATSTNERTPLDGRISNLLHIPTSTILAIPSSNQLPGNTETADFENDHISQWIASQTSNESSTTLNSTIDESSTSYKRPEDLAETDTNVPFTIEMEDSIPISAKQLETLARREHRHKLQREIITLAKRIIKPSFKKHYITKEVYKIIMKKVVTKATYSNKIDQKWIEKSINGYVRKYRTVQSI